MKRVIAPAILIGLFLGATSVPQTFTDDVGYRVHLTSPPQRIISLAPNITEILYQLDLQDKIIAVTQYCDYPPEVKEKPTIGGYINPNLEKIIALKPDLILGFRGNPLPLIHKLQSLGLPIFVLDEGQTISSLLRMIDRLGKVTFKAEKAASLRRQLESILSEIDHKLTSTTNKPRVLLTFQGSQLWSCGEESFLNDLITRAGGINIWHDIHRAWFVAQAEEIILKNPEIIIILAPDINHFNQTKQFLFSLPRFNQIKAIRNQKIFFIDEDLVSRLSPRLIEALPLFLAIFHPELTSCPL